MRGLLSTTTAICRPAVRPSLILRSPIRRRLIPLSPIIPSRLCRLFQIQLAADRDAEHHKPNALASGDQRLEVPDDITVSEAVTDDKAQSEQPKQTRTQATEPAKSDETKPKQSQTNQPQSSQESAVTTTQNAIEEVEIELDIQSTEAVTTVTEETAESTSQTEPAPAAAPEPYEDDSHKPAGAVVASAVAAAVVAVIAVVGVILWKKKK